VAAKVEDFETQADSAFGQFAAQHSANAETSFPQGMNCFRENCGFSHTWASRNK
jgi:hypothetical protein